MPVTLKTMYCASYNLLDKGWRFGQKSCFRHQCTCILLSESSGRQIPPEHGHSVLLT